MKIASPSMIQAVATVLDAVRDALRDAAQALAAGGQEPVAQRQWQSAHAALQVVDHPALVRFSAELGAVIPPTDGHAAADRAAAFTAGSTALTDYMTALVAGKRDQSLRLWPAYQVLQRAHGVAQPMESDLFFPELNVAPGERPASTPLVPLTADELRGTRRLLETGLLQWLRKGERSGLQQIHDAVTRVEAAQDSARARRLWWVAQGVLGALLHDGLAADALARRLITQLNLHLGRLLQGAADTPPSLLRDALFLAARAQPVTPHVAEVQRVCGLQGALELDEPVAAAGFSAAAVAHARQQMEGLQPLWSDCTTGVVSTAEFERRSRALAGACEALRVPALTSLVTQLADSAHQLARHGATAGATVSDAAALEGACALLMVEQALAADHAPEAAFTLRAQHMAARLKVSVESPQALSALPPAQLLDEAALQAQGAQHQAVVRTEIERNLRDVEQALEAWFGSTSKPAPSASLSDLDKPLRQISGAFAVLGHNDAAALARQCRADVARYAQGAPCSEDEGRVLSRQLTVLSSFTDALKFGPVELDSVLTRLSLTVQMLSVPSQPEPASAAEPVAAAVPAAVAVATVAAAAVATATALPVAEQPPAAVHVPVDGAGDTDPEMLDIFLEEAGEVLASLPDAVAQSRAQPADQEHLTTLRRAFHTLKGSGRMVGLQHIGEAAWSMEQVLNDRQAQQQPGSADLYRLIEYAHDRFAHWIDALRANRQVPVDAAQLAAWAGKVRAGEALPPTMQSDTQTQVQAEAPAATPPAATPEPVTVPVAAPEPATEVSGDDSVRIGELVVNRALYDIVLPEARDNVSVLQAENRRVQEGAPVAPAFVRAAHTLRGISATAGFTAVSKLAASLEHALEQAATGHQLGRAAPHPDARNLIGRAVSALAEQIDSVADRNAPASHAELVAELNAVGAASLEMPAAATVVPTQVLPLLPSVPPVPPVPPLPPQVQTAVMEPPSAPAAPMAEPAAGENGTVTLPIALAEYTPGVERRRSRLDDDVDSQLLPIFLEEAAELVPQVGQDLRAWRARPEDKLVAQSLKRLLHTLKGSARMAGAMALGQLTHSMESRIENAQLLPSIPDSLIDDLETSFDRIGMLISRLQGDDTGPWNADDAQLTQAMEQMARTMQMATASGAMTQAMPVQSMLDMEGFGGQAPGVPRPMIRVRADLIDRLANQAGEVSIARARVSTELRSARGSLRDLTDNVSRLRAQLRELEIQAETQMQSRFSPAPGLSGADGKFDPLEFDRFTRLQELTRLMAESVNDVATVQHSLARDLDESEKALAAQAITTRDVQQDLMAIRMVQFSSISDRLYRVSRLSAKDSEKRVALDIIGEHVEIDRSVMDRIAAPIEHLLRNAIVHGIEAPAQRLELGKAEAGALKLEVRQEGNEVALSLADDGAGLNIARIREKAIGLGMMREDESLTDQQIGNFIFRSGFSTAAAVTTEAGRGVGMDVVMSEITALGGRVNTSFERGKGTTFMIHLPLTLSVLQSVVMRLNGSYYAVPTMMVQQVQRLKTEVLDAALAAREIEWQGARYPFHHLRTLLDAEAGEAPLPYGYGAVLLLRTGGQRAAIQVDDIVGGQEIVIKNIGPQLARVPGVTGAAVLGSGETVLILNPVLLTQRYLEADAQVRTSAAPALEAAVEPERQRHVLVVDDSLTVRKITGRLLTREGYNVVVAKDGIEALEKLREQMPDVMITDVEMPRMDGFDLTRNVRAEDSLKHLPIIMITSRTAEKHRQHASELGVDVFLGKPYEESELLRQIAALARGQDVGKVKSV
jgi:chemosensory pili system protein ChpA (sensor histidine kinase/response regulator)